MATARVCDFINICSLKGYVIVMASKFSDFFNYPNAQFNNKKIEEVIEKTKDAAESFGKKSVEHLEVSRKMVECLDAKAKLNKLYEKFGEINYNAYIGETVNGAELEDIANRIAELKEKVSQLDVEIEIAKSKFNDAVSAAAQKTRDAFQKSQSETDAKEVEVQAEESDAE